jgi:hypothetical protein
MPTTVKLTNAAPKKTTNSKLANVRQGRHRSSRKRYVSGASESSSDEGTRRSRKRPRQKGKGKRPVPAPEESVEESSSEESAEPDIIEIEALRPESDTERELVSVGSLLINDAHTR